MLGRSQAPSTVLTDVREGLLLALGQLHERYALFERRPQDLSVLEGKLVLASSSAAGGLRIAVVGNVPGLTVQAANQAALGAGAKIVGSTAFKLAADRIQEIERLRPDMILLTGGVDGGDADTISHNAGVLASAELSMPIVIAGNQAVGEEIAQLLRQRGKEVRLVDNVMPRSGTLAVESAREEIRKLFMERITHAKGLDQVKQFVEVVLPTPMAVLEGLQLGADGTTRKKAGAICSWSTSAARPQTCIRSVTAMRQARMSLLKAWRPYAKRTVEGDLGIRFNAMTILNRVGLEKLTEDLNRDFSEHSVPDDAMQDYIEQISRETGTVPQEPWHFAADAVLARAAVDLAVARHVGRRERIIAREGEAWAHYGKDLRDTHT